MKTATVREIRNDFATISKWLESGEVVQVLKRGKPFARIVPEPKRNSFLGACPSLEPLPADIDAPVGVEWEAAR